MKETRIIDADKDALDYLEEKTGLHPEKLQGYVETAFKIWQNKWELKELGNGDFKGITRMTLVGSYRKQNASEDSDIDVLVGYKGTMHWDKVEMINELRETKLHPPKRVGPIKIDILPVKDKNFEKELKYHLSEKEIPKVKA